MAAVQDCPEALTIAMSYHESKAEAVPDPLPVLATELIAALSARFMGEQQELLEKVQTQYNAFTCSIPCHDLMADIDQLKYLILKLTQFGQPPTEESKVEKLKTCVRNEQFEALSQNLSFMPAATTFTQFCDACKKFVTASVKKGTHSVNFIKDGKKPQYSAEEKKAYALKKKKERESAKGHKKDKGQKKMTCWNCQKQGHGQWECPYEKQEEEEEPPLKRTRRDKLPEKPKLSKLKAALKRAKDKAPTPKSGNRNWQAKAVLKEKKKPKPILVDDDEDEEEDSGAETDMIGAVDDDDVQSIFMTSGQATNLMKQRIFLDSCASTGLLIVRDSNFLDVMETAAGRINLTKKGAFMDTQGIGKKGTWSGITVYKESVKENMCSGPSKNSRLWTQPIA